MARRSTSPQTVLEYNRDVITTVDMQCLNRREFLNDRIINFYMKYMWETYLDDDEKKTIYVCDTFFMETIERSDDERIQRLLKRVSVMDHDYLMIPVMMNEHWFLMILCHPKSIFDDSRRKQYEPKIHIMDSMENYDPDKKQYIINALYKYVQAAAVLELNMSDDAIGSLKRRLRVHYADVYQQKNTFDCGICLLQNAECFLIEMFHIAMRDRPFQISRDRYPRKKLIALIEHLAAEKAILASRNEMQE